MKAGIKEYKSYFAEQKQLHKAEQQRQQQKQQQQKGKQYRKQSLTTPTSVSKPNIPTAKTSPGPINKTTTTVAATKRRRMAIESDSESDIAGATGNTVSNIQTESASTSSNNNNSKLNRGVITTSDATSSPKSSNTISHTHTTRTHINTSTNGNSSSTEMMDLCSDNPEIEQKNAIFDPDDLLNPTITHNATIKNESSATLPDTTTNTFTIADLTKEHLTTLFEQTILSPREEAELNEYKRRVDIRDAQLAALDLLSLPGNPLDVIIDSVGGPGKVAEMTGRKSRLVRDDSTGTRVLF